MTARTVQEANTTQLRDGSAEQSTAEQSEQSTAQHITAQHSTIRAIASKHKSTVGKFEAKQDD